MLTLAIPTGVVIAKSGCSASVAGEPVHAAGQNSAIRASAVNAGRYRCCREICARPTGSALTEIVDRAGTDIMFVWSPRRATDLRYISGQGVPPVCLMQQGSLHFVSTTDARSARGSGLCRQRACGVASSVFNVASESIGSYANGMVLSEFARSGLVSDIGSPAPGTLVEDLVTRAESPPRNRSKGVNFYGKASKMVESPPMSPSCVSVRRL
jgi:hypothetical protein